MCALRPVSHGPRGTRRPRRTRIPGPLLVLLGCLPGLAAVAALGACAGDVGDASSADRTPRHAAARPAAGHRGARPPVVPRTAWLDVLAWHAPRPTGYDDNVFAVLIHQ
ncbi:N-acetylmuramoyl-L-alanine amidase, partial [Streptomyces sp. FL07-04A]|nr:N-acetylmuramoyl-L-alanine amidase [Streptomyces sp. FL07-04A]